MDVALKVYSTEGGLRGLYKGLVPTLSREVPGNALMFGSYEYLKRKLSEAQVPASLILQTAKASSTTVVYSSPQAIVSKTKTICLIVHYSCSSLGALSTFLLCNPEYHKVIETPGWLSSLGGLMAEQSG